MRLFAKAKTEPVIERRSGPRTRVDCIATLVMPSGDRPGRLFDISATGARLTTDVPPAPGCSALLDWTTHEAFCRVTWSKPGMCGVEFDTPLPDHALQATIEAAPVERHRPIQTSATQKRDSGPARLFC